jgi:hypothetical protein
MQAVAADWMQSPYLLCFEIVVSASGKAMLTLALLLLLLLLLLLWVALCTAWQLPQCLARLV